MKKQFPQSTAQPEPDVVMPSPTFPLHMPAIVEEMSSPIGGVTGIIPLGPSTSNDISEDDIEFIRRQMESAGSGVIMPLREPIAFTPAAFLYVERKPARIYQFPGRPSPGDLKRIERKQLSVFGLDGGKFVRFLPNGSTEPVESHGEVAANA